MNRRYNVLTLDPMYSPLHAKIASILAKKKYAITSCVSKKIYLPRFKQYLAVDLIESVCKEQAKAYHAQLAKLNSYHHAYARKFENRKLTEGELNYMARFYIALEDFIVSNNIELVILHNETRWYHAVTIEICKRHKIKYLVTEQGLIRPFTTIIDPRGTSANSLITFDTGMIRKSPYKGSAFPRCKGKHDSLKSMLFFLMFLIGFTCERLYGNKTIVRYMHNGYSLKKYGKRLIRCFYKKKANYSEIKTRSILLLLQLERDSQVLLHSHFSSNQQVIDFVVEYAKVKGLDVAVKLHPLDNGKYQLPTNGYFVDGKVAALAEQSELVFTINSSASIDVIKTTTPLILLGDSIYSQSGIAEQLDFKIHEKPLIKIDPKVDLTLRKRFLEYLQSDYLLSGAGYSFDNNAIKYKLKELLN
ncbi:phosphoribosylamine--glycine ligase [Vibrio europaeus]|uniref:Phosphoribosylamine--glycine ligase n=1 Tax=Vibrio europaeus TaxID=300876 RepID=A0AAE7B1C4_9VIBR|nr:phosphoribosylamine--glycine ligase [Vibrio europaeus]QJY38876.1 phosphoribosylamine--glycine ligase [Vibrio europaeus]